MIYGKNYMASCFCDFSFRRNFRNQGVRIVVKKSIQSQSLSELLLCIFIQFSIWKEFKVMGGLAIKHPSPFCQCLRNRFFASVFFWHFLRLLLVYTLVGNKHDIFYFRKKLSLVSFLRARRLKQLEEQKQKLHK